jgi:hypothetical protein
MFVMARELVGALKFPAAFAIVMPRKGEGSTAVVVESFIDRVRSEKQTKAA